MKINQITVGISRTFNLGSYESARFEVQAQASLSDKDTPESATEAMLPHLRKMLIAAYNEHIDGKGKGKDL
jgi:hypothetical protein